MALAGFTGNYVHWTQRRPVMAIADVRQEGSYLKVFDEKGKKMSDLYVSSNMEFMGVASDFYIVKDGSYLKTYGADSRKIADLYISSNMAFKSAAGSSFNVQDGSYIKSYDKNCKKTGERYSR
jgi:hypothetical protein